MRGNIRRAKHEIFVSVAPFAFPLYFFVKVKFASAFFEKDKTSSDDAYISYIGTLYSYQNKLILLRTPLCLFNFLLSHRTIG